MATEAVAKKIWHTKFETLQKVVGNTINVDVTPGTIADDFDHRSINEFIVEIYALSDKRAPLEEFIETIF